MNKFEKEELISIAKNGSNEDLVDYVEALETHAYNRGYHDHGITTPSPLTPQQPPVFPVPYGPIPPVTC
jgi:hypothetical protein